MSQKLKDCTTYLYKKEGNFIYSRYSLYKYTGSEKEGEVRERKSVEININLSLRPKYVTSERKYFQNSTIQLIFITAKVESAASRSDPSFTSDKVKEVRKNIRNVLKENYSALEKLLKVCLEPFATEMYCHGLISETAKNSANFSNMMSEFESVMDFIDDSQELVKHCELFLQSLVKQGIPHKRAANCIAEKWTANVKEKLGINIKFDIEC